ncbi:MAG: cytochrome b [Rhodospirillaceae bacterium]|nr:cytochrome b [Rhodospirillaceae bacterium]
MLANGPDRYGLVSKLLHWLIAAGIVGLVILGWWMVGLSYYDAWYNRGLALHRAFGLIVLALAILFVGWRLLSPPPRLQQTLKPWERAAANTVHVVLLAAMVAIPTSGYFISTSAGAGVPIFGLFEVPALTAVPDRLRDLAIAVHYYLAYGVIAVAAMHAGAALKHQFIDRDGTLKRMLW